jgi:hypothetical protein
MRIVVGCFTLALGLAPLGGAQQPLPKECGADTGKGAESVRLYLSPIRIDSGYRLTPYSYSGATHVEQNIIDFTTRADSARALPIIGVASRKLNTWNSVQFVSPPLAGPFELGGLFSGRLELLTNKPNFDFAVSLYELTAAGDYILSSMYSTASASADQLHLSGLQPGTRQYVDYQSPCFARRLVQNGSRLLVLVTVLKPTFAANSDPGSGVSDAAIGDVNAPLRVGWYGNSYIDLRVRHH